MITIQGMGFPAVTDELKEALRNAPAVRTEKWQGVSANQETKELRNVVFEIPLHGVEDIHHWQKQIRPNLPWADIAFEERVCGMPVNPGEAWKEWPWAKSAANFVAKRFEASYQERFWPQYARRTEDGRLLKKPSRELRFYPDKDTRPNVDPSGEWAGDLQSLVELLSEEPYTRQAYIPLFWPHETGKTKVSRRMCSLGYQFIVRNSELHMYYPLRSCDFVHHWADDCYMAIRMLIWIMDRCRERNAGAWDFIKPGTFMMHCTSLHVFKSDVDKL